jgi:hypothetical protein
MTSTAIREVESRELESGDGIGPHSLSLRGSTLPWTNGGETRSAVLE